jgi:uncharacterized protein
VALLFEWDANKAKDNITRHRVSFEEAATVFRDPLELMSPDTQHSVTEERWISIGMSDAYRLLVVFYTQHGATIRIISARLPTIQERKAYEEGEA